MNNEYLRLVVDHTITFINALSPSISHLLRTKPFLLQIMEELENLEETLNDSIRESLGARSGKASRASQKASLEEEDDALRYVH